jgi:hypothetical protein
MLAAKPTLAFDRQWHIVLVDWAAPVQRLRSIAVTP